MAQFVFAIIFFLAALVLAGGAYFAGPSVDERSSGMRPVFGGLAVLVALLAFGLYAWGGVKSVGVKSVGVPQAFGAVTGGEYGPGVHETWQPWIGLTDVDGTVQTTTFEGSDCLTVRIGGQQTACADVTIQWQVEPGAATSLFKDYANHGDLMHQITDAVVVREFKSVVNQQLGDYNPITDVQNVAGTNTSSQFSGIGPQILAAMRRDIGGQIEVKSVYLPQLHYSASLESKLGAIQQSYADYAIATENVKVAQEQSKAYAKLGAPSMNELVAQCLTEAKTNTNLQCIPGATSNLSIAGK